MTQMIFPLLCILLLIYAMVKRTDLYGAFTDGAGEGLKILVNILPYLASMFIALNALRTCGALNGLIRLFTPVCTLMGLPGELAPLAVLKPLSGSASMGLTADIIKEYGPDSYLGFCACIMMGSCETVLYTISVYLGSIGITKSRYALPVSFCSALAGMAGAAAAADWFWPYG